MLARNFLWKNSIYLCLDGFELDLHNCYDFRSVHYDIANRCVTLAWSRSVATWVASSLPRHAKVVMNEVEHFHFKPRDPEMPFSEDDCLEAFGYDSEETGSEGLFWTDKLPEVHWRWSFLFQSGAELLVTGKDANAELEI